ncbi:MAG: hypothetical protein ACTS78_03040 [Arsenophonus sp. NC-WZS1-MAG3]
MIVGDDDQLIYVVCSTQVKIFNIF